MVFRRIPHNQSWYATLAYATANIITTSTYAFQHSLQDVDIACHSVWPRASGHPADNLSRETGHRVQTSFAMPCAGFRAVGTDLPVLHRGALIWPLSSKASPGSSSAFGTFFSEPDEKVFGGSASKDLGSLALSLSLCIYLSLSLYIYIYIHMYILFNSDIIVIIIIISLIYYMLYTILT